MRDALRDKAILVRDRSYEIPGGVRITAGTREQAQARARRTGEDLVKDLLIFDMDGVLVDVTESYRATIQATVKHFTGDEPSREEIQDWKNRGGWNDDWQLSTRMIQERGGKTPYDEVVDYFQKLFHGDGTQRR